MGRVIEKETTRGDEDTRNEMSTSVAVQRRKGRS